MKNTSKHNAGFTLIELVVAMAIAVVVTAAATAVLLMGLRINRQTGDTASRQMTVRQLLNVVQDAAAEGTFSAVEMDFNDPITGEKQYGSWQIKGEKGEGEEIIIFCYNAEEQKIYANGTPVLDGVYASNAYMEGQLLQVAVETKEGVFSSTIYCRMAESVEDGKIDSFFDNTSTGSPELFLDILKKEYRSRGEIQNGENAGQYYSEWYCGGSYDPGWNERTPWCACFISWALNEMGDKVKQPESRLSNDKTYYKWFADVDDFLDYFTDTRIYGNYGQRWIPQENREQIQRDELIGNLIFFDWDKDTDPDHVGVVLDVKTVGNATMVYTIEGNSAGRVTVRSYSIGDFRIMGYGILPWQSAASETE